MKEILFTYKRMRLWYILGFVLLIVIGIGVFYVWFRNEEREGFETGNNIVYTLTNPNNVSGLLTRRESNDICVLLGGRLAKYVELKDKKFPKSSISDTVLEGFRGETSTLRKKTSPLPLGMFVYDTNVPYLTDNEKVYYHIDEFTPFANNSKYGSANYIPYDYFKGYPVPYRASFSTYDGDNKNAYPIFGFPYCYGPDPGSRVTIKTSEFRKTQKDPKSGVSYTPPETITYDVVKSGSVTTANTSTKTIEFTTPNLTASPAPTPNSYKILDLNAVYMQTNIAQLEFYIRQKAVINAELANINKVGEFIQSLEIQDYKPSIEEIVTSALTGKPLPGQRQDTPSSYNLGGSIEGQRLQGGYLAAIFGPADYTMNINETSSMLEHLIWNYAPGNNVMAFNTIDKKGFGNISSSAYKKALILEIQNYYNALLYNFQTHPVSAIMKGISSYPSLLNTMPVYNLPKVDFGWLPHVGNASTTKWVFGNDKIGDVIQLHCPLGADNGYGARAMKNAWGNGQGPGDFNWPKSYNEIGPNVCIHTVWGTPGSCPPGSNMDWTWWNLYTSGVVCIQGYPLMNQPLWASVGFLGFDTQEAYEDDPKYSYPKNLLDNDDTWRPTSTDPSTKAMADSIKTKYKEIKFYGTISEICMKEIQTSVSLSVRLNFTDYSTVEKQIRISSDPPHRLYMSADASALPEYQTDISDGQIRITPKNNGHNNIHCNIEITNDMFFLLPFQARNIITNWAVARYNTVSLSTPDTSSAEAGSTQQNILNLGSNCKSFGPYDRLCVAQSGSLNTTVDSSVPFSSVLANTNIGGYFYSTSIPLSITPTDISGSGSDSGSGISGIGSSGIGSSPDNLASRRIILDACAQMYYENEYALQVENGSVTQGSTRGQTFIYKIMDIYTIGKTILDVRFEESQQRSLEFIGKLNDLEAKYRQYMKMNLSKDDILAIEAEYIIEKEQLYAKNSENIWSSAQQCGVQARYVQITCSGNFNLSQVVVIDNTGANVALGATVTGPACVDYGTSNPGLPAKDFPGIPKDIPVSPGAPIPMQMLCDSKGNFLTDAPTPSSPNGPAVAYQLSKIIFNTQQAYIMSMQSSLVDGTMKSRWFPNTYRTVSKIDYPGDYKVPFYDYTGLSHTVTSSPSTSILTIDLAALQTVCAVRLILPLDTALNSQGTQLDNTKIPTYTIKLLDTKNAPVGQPQVAGLPTVGQNSTFFPDFNPRTLITTYSSINDPDFKTCPNFAYDRYKVARFYFDPPMKSDGVTPTYDITDSRYWKLTGYSVGVDSALSFNPLYNSGTQMNLSSAYGNFMYPPTTIFNQNKPQPPMVCSDPEQVKKIFGDYNINVNDPNFAAQPGVSAALSNPPSRIFRADTVYGYKQIDANKCEYYWSDKAIDISTDPNTTDPNTYYRRGTFNYIYNTVDWEAQDRLYVPSNTVIYTSSAPDSTNNGYTQFSSGPIVIPNHYIASTVLDTANGVCPALPCSDNAVMASLIGNSNVNTDGTTNYGVNSIAFVNNQNPANPRQQLVSKIYKAVTPSSASCEYLVDTTDAPGVMKKLFILLKVVPPSGTTPCAWVPLQTSFDDALSPNMIDNVPFLTRAYNYAADTIAPYTAIVKSAAAEILSIGSAQADPAGSGIVNSVVQYRSDTNSAAGEVRYFDDTDEFGNKCAVLPSMAAGSDVTVSPTANFPRCKSPNMVLSLMKYWGINYSDKITGILAAGLNEQKFCDYSFTTAPVTSAGTVNSALGATTGLRCSATRLPFSCEYTVNTCSYINPTPAVLSDVDTFPVTGPVSGSGSGSGSGSTTYNPNTGFGSGSYNPITAAASNQDPSLKQTIIQPQLSPVESVDWINCTSDYAKAALGLPLTAQLTNSDNSTCKVGTTTYKFIKSTSSTNYLYSPATPATNTFSGLAAPTSAPPASLLPFTTVYGSTTITANSIYEYRITNSDKLPFGSTYVRAEFYKETTGGASRLKVLRPATVAESPNSFLKSTNALDKTVLATTFLNFWNTTLFKNTNSSVGNKIGAISGYYVNTANDSVVFRTNSADFGNLGGYDVRNYYSDAYYEVNFRNKFAGGATFIYSVNPAPGKPIQTTYSVSNASFTAISIGSAGSAGTLYSVVSPSTLVGDKHLMRYVRFTATAFPAAPAAVAGRVEMARMAFYTSTDAGKTFTMLPLNSMSVSVQGILANYDLFPATATCASGYSQEEDPISKVAYCKVKTPDEYNSVPNTACGIGYNQYTKADKTIACKSNGYFQDFINMYSLFVGNSYTPRLRLTTPNHTHVTVDLNAVSMVDAFSFITGSQGTLPTKWTVTGSIDGNQWTTLHNQTTTSLDYSKVPSSTTAFYNPGIFKFGSTDAPISQGRTDQFSDSRSNITTEGFLAKPTKAAVSPLKESFVAPLSELYTPPLVSVPRASSRLQEVDSLNRIQSVRFRWLETQNPESPFIHMSRLEFHTKSGIVPPECIRISNQHGTRRSGKTGPDALLANTAEKRWIDYNKSELLVQFNTSSLPADKIHGYRFHVPRGVDGNSLGSLPAKWTVEGSYDRRNWFSLHEKSDRARIMGEASPVYKFLQQV